MADIQVRFFKDMLVLSAPLEATLARQGIDTALDRQYLNLMESDSVVEALRLQVMAGAQCVVTTTEDITKARLTHSRMEGDEQKIAQAALEIAHEVSPQHILAEIGPCGLPLDPDSKASLNENRLQYTDAAKAFADGQFDGYFLNGFTSIPDLKCALMGIRQVSDLPLFASVLVGEEPVPVTDFSLFDPALNKTSVEEIEKNIPLEGCQVLDTTQGEYGHKASSLIPMKPQLWPEALQAMIDLEASVVGFETAEPLAQAMEYAQIASKQTDRPVLAQLRVIEDPLGAAAKSLTPLEDLKEYTPDTLPLAARNLHDVGVQFLRATGDATPACTGALAAAVFGLDVR